MNTYFETKIRYEKMTENGMNKKVTEPYIVDALSFTEAEAKIIEEMKPFISGDFEVAAIKKARYSEVVRSDNEKDDKWFDAKIAFITIDEKSGAEKRTSTHMLFQSSSVDDTHKKVCEHMKDTLSDYEIEAIKETKIMDVFLP